MPGTLYLCATPIGNLKDITERVLETLKNADLIAAEDTRNSMKLMTHFDIHAPMTSYHEHNKYEKADELVEKLMGGTNVALITDAGTPAISDPGEVLVQKCIEAGVPVTSLPGPSAVITALTLSGLSAGRFSFEGFLSRNKKERREILEELKHEKRTIIIYEAPHHLKATLKDLLQALGDRRIAICRELTKKHEDIMRGTLSDAAAYYEENDPRGEYVLVIEGVGKEETDPEDTAFYKELPIEEHMKMYEKTGMERKEAMKAVAKDRGITRREVYRSLLGKRSGEGEKNE